MLRHRSIAGFLLLVTLGYGFALSTNAQGQITPSPKQSDKQEPQSSIDDALSDEMTQDETLSVTTTLVNVPVQVMDRDGRFVADLHAEDFALYEEGVPQKIAFFNPVETPFTVVLLIDTSPSTYPYRKEIRTAAISFIDQLRPEDRIMVVAFNGSIKVLSKPQRDREELRKAVKKLSWDGTGTLLYGTVELLIKRFFNRLRGRKALVVLSDGEDADARVSLDHFISNSPGKVNHGKETITLVGFPPCNLIPCLNAKQALSEVEESDTIIYSIQFVKPFVEDCQNVPENADPQIKWSCEGKNYLNGLAEETGGRFFHADDPKQFEPTFSSIAQELRYQYGLAYYPTNTATPRERRAIKVTVKRENTVVRARKSYVYQTRNQSR